MTGKKFGQVTLSLEQENLPDSDKIIAAVKVLWSENKTIDSKFL